MLAYMLNFTGIMFKKTKRNTLHDQKTASKIKFYVKWNADLNYSILIRITFLR
jgi:hypothetical protein